MRRFFTAGMLLGLAVIALLVLAASPASAADACDCHTAVPPTGGAPAVHTAYVAAVTDCVVCHSSWTAPPHPDVVGELQLRMLSRASDAGLRLRGSLEYRKRDNFGAWIVAGQSGVVVYVQQRPWRAAGFTDLAQVTTGTKGGFAQVVASPAPFAAYRAVAQGHVGPTGLDPGVTGLFMPTTATLLPTPDLRLRIRGPFSGGYATRPSIELGRTITVRGTVAPSDLGGRVTVRVQRNIEGIWVRYYSVKRKLTTEGTYSWKWTPQRAGRYRISARIPTTAEHAAARTGFEPVRGWRSFDVI